MSLGIASSTTRRSDAAINRGLDFIYRTANQAEAFASYGGLMICCFALVGATTRDQSLRRTARSRAKELFRRWRRLHPSVPPGATVDELLDFVMLRYALSRIGMRDPIVGKQLRTSVERCSVQDLLGFNPLSERPPNDLPFKCDCGGKNVRGRKRCKHCGRQLDTQSCYRVWMEAVANTYVSQRCGLIFGAPHREVLKWLPTLRPYPSGREEAVELLRDSIYAVTHLIYVLNDYGTYRLSPRLLPLEFTFLKENVASACDREDSEILGELLDALRAFGLGSDDALIKQGTEYLLESQNKDGSWGALDEENIRTRCHTTWTAIDGLRSYAWRGERVIRPEIKAILRA